MPLPWQGDRPMHYPLLFPVASIPLSGCKCSIDVVVSQPTNIIPDEIRNLLCSRRRIPGRRDSAWISCWDRGVSELFVQRISILGLGRYFLHPVQQRGAAGAAGHSSVSEGRCPKLMQSRRVKTPVGKILQCKLFQQELFNISMLSTHRHSLKLNTRAELLVC